MTTAELTSVRASVPQWAQVARRMAKQLLYNTAWFWGVCLVFATLAIIVLNRLQGQPPFSIFSLVRHGLIWYPFASALVIVAVVLVAHVSAGQTRRSFLLGSMTVWTGYAILNGTIMAAVLTLEANLYADRGWPHLSTSSADIAEFATGVIHYPLCALAGACAGLLVGLTYHRVGGWATFALPLTCAPAIFAAALDPEPVALAGIALSIGMAGLACFMIGRRIPLRTTATLGAA